MEKASRVQKCSITSVSEIFIIFTALNAPCCNWLWSMWFCSENYTKTRRVLWKGFTAATHFPNFNLKIDTLNVPNVHVIFHELLHIETVIRTLQTLKLLRKLATFESVPRKESLYRCSVTWRIHYFGNGKMHSERFSAAWERGSGGLDSGHTPSPITQLDFIKLQLFPS